MTAYVSTDPLRHPWFGPPTLKRKHSDPDSDVEGDLSEQDTMRHYPTPPPSNSGWASLMSTETKGESSRHHVEEASSDAESGSDTRQAGLAGQERKRRRYEAVERRMARMSLEGNANPSSFIEQEMDAEPLDGNTSPIMNDSQRSFSRPPFVAPPMSTSLSIDSNASSTYGYAYTAGSLSPVSKSAILSQYAVEEPTSPEALRIHTSLPSLKRDNGFSVEEVHGGNDGLAAVVTEVKMDSAEPAMYERAKDREYILVPPFKTSTLMPELSYRYCHNRLRRSS